MSKSSRLCCCAKQLKSLFHPAVHKPYWKLDEIMTEDNKTLDGKPISKDVAAVLRALAKQGEQQAFCLVAPAFRGQFSDLVTPGMMRTAFKSIGFDGFIEIAVFADILTLREALEFERNIRTQQDYMLTSCCCPMWLAMIRKLYSCLMPHVPASVSPMIAAGRVVKKLHPGALILASAVVDPSSRMHSTDESLHLGDFAKACRAEALFLQALADS